MICHGGTPCVVPAVVPWPAVEQHLPHNDAKREHIRVCIQLLLQYLLRARPVWRAGNLAHRLAVVMGKGAEPKVGDFGAKRVVQQHIGALEVAVHNVVCVQVRHPGCHLCHNPQRRHQVQRVAVDVQVVEVYSSELACLC